MKVTKRYMAFQVDHKSVGNYFHHIAEDNGSN